MWLIEFISLVALLFLLLLLRTQCVSNSSLTIQGIAGIGPGGIQENLPGANPGMARPGDIGRTEVGLYMNLRFKALEMPSGVHGAE